ncbi:hypothetical protein GLOIN_2v831674 [Rhizophagus clarus]|uniref:Endonuclease/exonuclease/phosphatase domain-containing protein n=2 Tax=Rhizophagus clarus TaxID=94130 RepID=A0A8H3QU47_9GLOM|nr:hypothetical protein GLOIN_2v831674 [Rhizophagus clarus]
MDDMSDNASQSNYEYSDDTHITHTVYNDGDIVFHEENLDLPPIGSTSHHDPNTPTNFSLLQCTARQFFNPFITFSNNKHETPSISITTHNIRGNFKNKLPDIINTMINNNLHILHICETHETQAPHHESSKAHRSFSIQKITGPKFIPYLDAIYINLNFKHKYQINIFGFYLPTNSTTNRQNIYESLTEAYKQYFNKKINARTYNFVLGDFNDNDVIFDEHDTPIRQDGRSVIRYQKKFFELLKNQQYTDVQKKLLTRPPNTGDPSPNTHQNCKVHIHNQEIQINANTGRTTPNKTTYQKFNFNYIWSESLNCDNHEEIKIQFELLHKEIHKEYKRHLNKHTLHNINKYIECHQQDFSDNQTRMLNSILARKLQKITIDRLLITSDDDNPQLITNPEDIKRITIDHYQNVASSNNPALFTSYENLTPFWQNIYKRKNTSSEQQSILTTPITLDELKTMIQSLPNNKAPGPTGITYEF